MSEKLIIDDYIKNIDDENLKDTIKETYELVFGNGNEKTITIFDYFKSNYFFRMAKKESLKSPQEPENSKMLMPENKAKIDEYEKILNSLRVVNPVGLKLCDFKIRRLSDNKELLESTCDSIKHQKASTHSSNVREIFLTRFVIEAMETQTLDYINEFNKVKDETKNLSDQEIANILSKTNFDKDDLEELIFFEEDIPKDREVSYNDLLPRDLVKLAKDKFGKVVSETYIEDRSLIDIRVEHDDILNKYKLNYALLEFAERKRIKTRDFLTNLDFEKYNSEDLVNYIGKSGSELFGYVTSIKKVLNNKGLDHCKKLKEISRILNPKQNWEYHSNADAILQSIQCVYGFYLNEQERKTSVAFKTVSSLRSKLFRVSRAAMKDFLINFDFNNPDIKECLYIKQCFGGSYLLDKMQDFINVKTILCHENLDAEEKNVNLAGAYEKFSNLLEIYENYFRGELDQLRYKNEKIFNEFEDLKKQIDEQKNSKVEPSKLRVFLEIILYIIPAILTVFKYRNISDHVTIPIETIKNKDMSKILQRSVKQIKNTFGNIKSDRD